MRRSVTGIHLNPSCKLYLFAAYNDIKVHGERQTDRDRKTDIESVKERDLQKDRQRQRETETYRVRD